MRTKVINFVGSPSCGKSLMSALIFSELKMRHYSAEIVLEYAKQLIYEKRFEELNNQYQVTTTQYNSIKAIEGKVKYICTCSPILLGIFYNENYDDNICNVEKVDKILKEKMSEFDNIYIYLERNNEYPYEIEGRVHNQQESEKIAIDLKNLLEENNLEYKSFLSDRSSVPEMLEYILSFN